MTWSRWLIALALLAHPAHVPAQSIGDKIKEIFATPTATPHHRKKSTHKGSPAPSPSASAKKKKSSPPPEPSPAETPAPTESPTPTPEPTAEKRAPANATLSPEAIRDFENYPAKVQKLLTLALELTTRNLDYKYGSADPANGGMDCSGFVYFILKENGFADVPRDSSQQYVWMRRGRTFEAVLSHKDDSFELDDLKPGDLLFWSGTYNIDRDPPITHAMIYLGREKKTGARVMVGASDGRTYGNQQRFGVSVFDFKIAHAEKGENEGGKTRPRFVGYGHLPGLQQ